MHGIRGQGKEEQESGRDGLSPALESPVNPR